MSKLIIHNRTELTDAEAMTYIYNVILGGKISNNGTQYCYATTFISKKTSKEYSVWTRLQGDTHTFYITEEK